MAGKLYVLGDIDFDALDRDLAELRPKKVGVEVVLERLRPRLAIQLRRGVTAAQMREVLRTHGVRVSESRLREFIDVRQENEGTGRTGVGGDSGSARGEDGAQRSTDPGAAAVGEGAGSEAGSGSAE